MTSESKIDAMETDSNLEPADASSFVPGSTESSSNSAVPGAPAKRKKPRVKQYDPISGKEPKKEPAKRKLDMTNIESKGKAKRRKKGWDVDLKIRMAAKVKEATITFTNWARGEKAPLVHVNSKPINLASSEESESE